MERELRINPPERLSVCRTKAALRRLVRRWKQKRLRIGFVPTMGYLHEGHLTLIRRARRDNPIVVVSIFVNPTQFGPHEDYERYPRDLERDLRLCEKEGVDAVFAPDVKEIYPRPLLTTVSVQELTEGLCGPFRPGHFEGVATVVAKLFHLVQPDRAYFGKKDYQQLRVIERMVSDLDLDVEIVPLPVVREKDGLAMSSRNRYLTPARRRRALALSRALQRARTLVASGEREVGRLKPLLLSYLSKSVKVEYVEFVHRRTLRPVTRVGPDTLLAIAAVVDGVRLIDNTEFDEV